MPLWINRAAAFLLTHLTRESFHGPYHFFLVVSRLDMVGEPTGTHRLYDHFVTLRNK